MKLRNDRKDQRRKEAEQRATARAKRSNMEQLARLCAGKHRALKERARLAN